MQSQKLSGLGDSSGRHNVGDDALCLNIPPTVLAGLKMVQRLLDDQQQATVSRKALTVRLSDCFCTAACCMSHVGSTAAMAYVNNGWLSVQLALPNEGQSIRAWEVSTRLCPAAVRKAREEAVEHAQEKAGCMRAHLAHINTHPFALGLL